MNSTINIAMWITAGLLAVWVCLWIIRFTGILFRWMFQDAFFRVSNIFLGNTSRIRDDFSPVSRHSIIGANIAYGRHRRCRRCVAKKRRIPRVATHVDHLWPARKGGPAKKWNACPLCAECNIEKSDSIEAWAVVRMLLPGWGW